MNKQNFRARYVVFSVILFQYVSTAKSQEETCLKSEVSLLNGQTLCTCDGKPISCTDGKCPVGTITNYQCNSGFNLTTNGGLPSRECLSDGSWDGSQPTCEVQGAQPTTVQGNQAPENEGGEGGDTNNIPIVIGVAVGVIVLAAFVGIAVCLVRRRQNRAQRDENYSDKRPNTNTPTRNRPAPHVHTASRPASGNGASPPYSEAPTVSPAAALHVVVDDKQETSPTRQKDKKKTRQNRITHETIDTVPDHFLEQRQSKPKKHSNMTSNREKKPVPRGDNSLKPADRSSAKTSGVPAPRGDSYQHARTQAKPSSSSSYTPAQMKRYEDLGYRSQGGRNNYYDGLAESDYGINSEDNSYAGSNAAPIPSSHGNSFVSYDYILEERST